MALAMAGNITSLSAVMIPIVLFLIPAILQGISSTYILPVVLYIYTCFRRCGNIDFTGTYGTDVEELCKE